MEKGVMSENTSKPQQALPGYFTINEAAEYLGYLSTGSLRLDCGAKKIPAFKLGKMWLIPESWVFDKARQDVSPIGARGQARK